MTTGRAEDGAVERLAVIAAGARDGLWDWDLASGVLSLSPRWKEILGYRDEEIGSGPEEWFRRVHPRDLDALKCALDRFLESDAALFEREFRLLAKDGSWRHVLCRAASGVERRRIGGSLTDITSAKLAEASLLHETFHDRLTDLPNEALFLDRLGLALSRLRRRREAQPVAVLYLDLDRFHAVNDSLGLQAGDQLLVEVARRLQKSVRLGDTLARLGGDKFGVLMDGVRWAREAADFAEEMGRVLREPLVLAGHEVFARGSIGIALSTSAGERSEDLLRDAVTAMHRAKADGSTLYQVFDPEMNAKAKERLCLEADLHRAVERGEFLLHYQPIISFHSGTLSGFEALMRWRHPERGLVPPDVFIPIAEENGLIIPMGRWVLDQACAQMKRWRDQIPAARSVAVAVNLSSRQFEDAGLVGDVEACLARTGLTSDALKLEMTESVIMARTRENQATLQALRDLGVKLLIDDFGTGYSSLASLHTFALDTLKIDRTFVSRMEFEEEKAEIVRTILALARKLDMDAVAEGVETAAELAMLRELGCEHGQGFYFSCAIDHDSAAAWIQSAPRW